MQLWTLLHFIENTKINSIYSQMKEKNNIYFYPANLLTRGLNLSVYEQGKET